MEYDGRFGAIECILFVSGDPVPMAQLQRALGVGGNELGAILCDMDKLYRAEKRGVQLYVTDDTVQLVSNKEYASIVQEMMQPVQEKSFSQAMLETLSIVAYRQPVTRMDIE
ncbi:MAG TPA: SMC-Scp complex subunit ScpB, partial [Clostridia bacterium]|nr:SMC-Scp complex subunit ScpB [Clostridia bacterium]